MEVCNRESVKSAFSDCMETFGAVFLVNNAGINKPTDFDEISDNDWDDILNVNLKGPLFAHKFCLTWNRAIAAALLILVL